MKKFFRTSLITFSAFFIPLSSSHACTDFKVTATDKDGKKTIFINRAMDFDVDMEAHLENSNRGRVFQTTAPDGKSAGLGWSAKYGYMYIDGFHLSFPIDGMNEKGLSFEALYLPGETEYQTVPDGKNAKSLPYTRLGDWVLSQFSTVQEVRDALKDIYVFAQGMDLPDFDKGFVFPLHMAVFDPSGAGIVIEFVGGNMNVYDNIGVMTNSPTYNWHKTNLRNYVNLTSYNPDPVTVNGFTYAPTGEGAGMVGLPGDDSPPSRFVKIAYLMNNVYKTKTPLDALNLAQHVINNVDLPEGLSRTKEKDGGEKSDKTQWADFKDLTHRIFYYRTYNDMTIRSIEMDKVDFSAVAPSLSMPLSEDVVHTVNMTNKFISSTHK